MTKQSEARWAASLDDDACTCGWVDGDLTLSRGVVHRRTLHHGGFSYPLFKDLRESDVPDDAQLMDAHYRQGVYAGIPPMMIHVLWKTRTAAGEGI